MPLDQLLPPKLQDVTACQICKNSFFFFFLQETLFESVSIIGLYKAEILNMNSRFLRFFFSG